MGSARAIIAILLAAPVAALAGPEPSQAELRAAKALDEIRGDPLALNEFLKRMPKGGELHLHLHSAVFAETLIQDAIEDKLCVDVDERAFDKRQVASDSAPSCV
jgi:adenosine deaminase